MTEPTTEHDPEKNADAEPDPLGLREFVSKHGWIRGPSIVVLALFCAVFIGGGILYISESNTTSSIDKASKAGLKVLRQNQEQSVRAQNAGACSIKLTLLGIRSRSAAAANDPSQSKSARARAKAGLDQLDTLIDGQITQPPNLDCKAFLRKLAAERKTHLERKTAVENG